MRRMGIGGSRTGRAMDSASPEVEVITMHRGCDLSSRFGRISTVFRLETVDTGPNRGEGSRSRLRYAEHRDREGRVVAPRAEIPRGEAVLDGEPGRLDIGVELLERVLAVGAEADRNGTVRAYVAAQVGQHGGARTWCEE